MRDDGALCLAGPRLGEGPIWSLRRAVGKGKVKREEVEAELLALEERTAEDEHEEEEEEEEVFKASTTRAYIMQLEVENARLNARCLGLLEQGLSQSEHADVRFVFEDGSSPLSGHKGMLCAASEEYEGMFRSGMMEARDGAVRVPPGVSVCAFRGFLEWVYLGECVGKRGVQDFGHLTSVCGCLFGWI